MHAGRELYSRTCISGKRHFESIAFGIADELPGRQSACCTVEAMHHPAEFGNNLHLDFQVTGRRICPDTR